MKRFLFIFSLIFLPHFANCTEIPININEYINKPYVGMEYYQALNQNLPFLLIFANPKNIVAIGKLAPIAQMVYDEFKGQYNFCIINTKIKENDDIINFFNPQKLPALYIIDTKAKTYTFIDKKYYKKRELKEILNNFAY